MSQKTEQPQPGPGLQALAEGSEIEADPNLQYDVSLEPSNASLRTGSLWLTRNAG